MTCSIFPPISLSKLFKQTSILAILTATVCISSLITITTSNSKAPFIQPNQIHQAYSQFEINLILNQNRNLPILLVTVSNNMSKNAVKDVLQSTHGLEKNSAFSILVECGKFQWNLNHTLGVCEDYYGKVKESKNGVIQEEIGTDSFFSCQIFTPSELKIREKGHTLMKNHNHQYIPDGKHFAAQYLSELIRKHIPDFVYYIEDQYQLIQFLQQKSDFKVSKQPKLLYFDENLLAPIFLRKLSALMDGKIQVAVTDDPPLAKRYSSQFESLIFLQYSFVTEKYQNRQIKFNQLVNNPEEIILADQRIQRYLRVKKNRDILLDFQHSNYTVYQFTTIAEIEYLQTQGRVIIVQFAKPAKQNQTRCTFLHQTGSKYNTLFNYICYPLASLLEVDPKAIPNRQQTHFYIITNSVSNGTWADKKTPILSILPQVSSRQKVSTLTEAQQCLRTANISQKYPIFYYFSDKNNSEGSTVVHYMNSLPQVTSLLYFCQIIVPQPQLSQKYQLLINTMFTMYDPSNSGYMKKLQHKQISSFLQIKMFLREIAIQKMLRVYEDRLINNEIQKISSNEHLTEKCFDRKCIVGLIATGRYRQEEEIKILKEIKLQYEELFRFVWIDGICHWDVPKQLKLLKKKEKVIDRSYVFFYNEKDVSYSLWESKKHWDKKELEKWIKSLKNNRKINHLKFAIDIQNRICKKKGQVVAALPEQL